MSNAFEVLELGTTRLIVSIGGQVKIETDDQGFAIVLTNELILQMADEIRSMVK